MIKYRIRWRFDYVGRPEKYGLWSLSTKNMSDQAWCHNYPGLLTASVEGKTFEGKIVRLAEMSGQDFMNFQWLAQAIIPGGMPKGTVRCICSNTGLRIIGRNETIDVFDSGVVKRYQTPEEFKSIKFATYGR